MTIQQVLKNISRQVGNNAPAILTGLGAAGVVTTTVLAVRVTPEASRRLEAEGDPDIWRKPLVVARLTWPLYVPATVSGLLTIGAVVGAHRVNIRRQAALIGAYSLIESNFREYKDKIIQEIGSSKEQRYRDELIQQKVSENPPSSQEISMILSGNVLCFDTFTGRYFQSDMETLRKAANDINQQCFHEMSASMNEFYSKIGLAPVQTGEAVGWNMDNPLELKFSTVLSEDNRPCLAVDYYRPPVANFHKLW